MYYYRAIDTHLTEWKALPDHKPLLLRGGRQVGKSSAVRQLGKSFDHFLEVNFERDPDMKHVFEKRLNPQEIAARLSVYYNVPVKPGKTLLFFDEIQACPNAIHSLWFFREDYPDLHVIAAGSLLEFALKKMQSFGVGRVRSMYMHPFSFDEFLMATGHESWVKEKQSADFRKPLFEPLHAQLVEAFRTYLLVGGMPESVAAWVKHGNYLKCRQVQDDIMQSYEVDFSKYEERVNPVLLRSTLYGVMRQIGEKFVYSRIQGEYRSEQVKYALTLLQDAGLIKPVYHTAANGQPLGAEINEKFVKYLFMDSGLLLRFLNLENTEASTSFQQILTATATDLVNKGHVTEMVAGLELLKYAGPFQRHDLYYWQNLKRGTQAEVDYVLIHRGQITPLEVKAGTSGSMKSMYRMMEEKQLANGLRVSLENFAQVGNVDILPLYALSNLFEAENSSPS